MFYPGCIGPARPELTSLNPQASECFHKFSLTLHPISSHMQWSSSKNAFCLKRTLPGGDPLKNRDQSPKFRMSRNDVLSLLCCTNILTYLVFALITAVLLAFLPLDNVND